MSRDSLEKTRLRFADAAMRDVYGSSEFRTAAEEAPFMIRTLGLGSGIAALAAKEGQRLTLAAMLAKWLLRDCPHSPYHDANAPEAGPPAVKSLLRKIAESDRSAYRLAQIEALGYAGWIKRLAQAFCPKT